MSSLKEQHILLHNGKATMEDSANQANEPKTKRSSLFVRKTPILQRLFQSRSSKAISIIVLTLLLVGGIYLISSLSKPSDKSTPAEEQSTWKTFSTGTVLFKHPSSWFNKDLQSTESGFTQEIESQDGIFLLTFKGSANSESSDLLSFIPENEQTYDIDVGGQTGLTTISQENSNPVVFFLSPENNTVYSLILVINDDKKILEGNDTLIKIANSIQLYSEKEEVDTNESCGLYYQQDKEIRACAVCGDGICDLYESCTASEITEQGPTDDCGPLYCPQDCE